MIRFVQKKDSKLMSFIGFFNQSFMENFWTTVGQTIYTPVGVIIQNEEDKLTHRIAIEHEMVHVRQCNKLTVPLFLFLYFLVPLPIFFSYFRWRFEREAYLTQLKANVTDVEEVVDVLWNGYFYPWPKTWMKRWFKKHK